MTITQNKKNHRLSLDVPLYILEQVDNICEETFITRRKWFLDAAVEKLEREKLNKIDMLVKK